MYSIAFLQLASDVYSLVPFGNTGSAGPPWAFSWPAPEVARLATGGVGGIAGLVFLGYPLHPMFKPQVRNPPEWPLLVKPALFVQGDHDPFCDLARLREELPRLREPHELIVVPNSGHSFEPKGAKRDTFPEVRSAFLDWITRRLSSE